MKKILFGFLCLIGFSSFCSAGQIILQGDNISSFPFFTIPLSSVSKDVQLHCVFSGNNLGSSTCGIFDFSFGYAYSNSLYGRTNSVGTDYRVPCNSSYVIDYDFNTFSPPQGPYQDYRMPLYVNFTTSFLPVSTVSYSCVLSGEYLLSISPSCPTCPSQYTSEECQSQYGLVSSGVLNSCQSSLSGCQLDLQSCQTSLSGWDNTLNNCSNNLLSCESSLASCIQSNCPIDTGSVMWSSIWINGIQHLGKPVINIDIPSNIYWDYSTNDEQFDLYIGSGYDQEYIDGVIAVNSYRPSSEDFTSAFVGGLTLVFPYIIIALFIIFVRKLIKRIFK